MGGVPDCNALSRAVRGLLHVDPWTTPTWAGRKIRSRSIQPICPAREGARVSWAAGRTGPGWKQATHLLADDRVGLLAWYRRLEHGLVLIGIKRLALRVKRRHAKPPERLFEHLARAVDSFPQVFDFAGVRPRSLPLVHRRQGELQNVQVVDEVLGKRLDRVVLGCLLLSRRPFLQVVKLGPRPQVQILPTPWRG